MYHCLYFLRKKVSLLVSAQAVAMISTHPIAIAGLSPLSISFNNSR